MSDYTLIAGLRHRNLDLWQVVMSGAILLLLFVSAIVNYSSISTVLRSESLPVSWSITALFFLLFFVPVAIGVLVTSLTAMVRSVRSLMIPDLPQSGSQPLRDYDEFRRGLQQRSLSYYQPLGAFASAILGNRTMYLSPLRRAIVAKGSERLKRRVLWVVVLGLLLLTIFWQADDSSGIDYKVILPFLLLLILQVASASVDFLTALRLLPPEVPAVESNEGQRFYQGFGHPANLFSRLPDLGEALRVGGVRNRVYLTKDERATVSVSDVGEFSGLVYIEQHPVAFEDGADEAVRLLLPFGWALRLLGGFALLFGLLPFEIHWIGGGEALRDSLDFGPVFVMTMTVAGLYAWWTGGRYVGEAGTLDQTVRYRSLAMLVGITGEISKATVSQGEGALDTVRSRNIAARSKFTARFWAASMITEGRTAVDPRDVLEMEQSGEAGQWIEGMIQGIDGLREGRLEPVGIEIESQQAREIEAANLGSFSRRVGQIRNPTDLAAASLGGLPETLLTAGSNESVVSPEPSMQTEKECPSCAEVVKMRARRCRFCGHDFDGSE